jgi:hypothetical protein
MVATVLPVSFLRKTDKNMFLVIQPQGGSPKWPLPMAIIFPVNSLKKFNFWPFDLRAGFQVATSNDNFSTMSLLYKYSNKCSHHLLQKKTKKHFHAIMQFISDKISFIIDEIIQLMKSFSRHTIKSFL